MLTFNMNDYEFKNDIYFKYNNENYDYHKKVEYTKIVDMYNKWGKEIERLDEFIQNFEKNI